MENTIKIALTLRESTALSLRRASLDAILCCFELFQFAQTQNVVARSNVLPNATNVLATLMDVSSVSSSVSSSVDLKSNEEIIMMESLIGVIDWSANSIKDESDQICHAMKIEIIRNGINIIETKSNL